MFGFFSLLHALDIDNLRDSLKSACEITTRIYGERRRRRQLDETGSSHSGNNESTIDDSSSVVAGDAEASLFEGGLAELQSHLHKEHLAKNLFDTVIEGVLSLVAQTQRRIDDTCASVGGLWIHLVFFSTMQVIAVSVGLREHTGNGVLAATEYRWCASEICASEICASEICASEICASEICASDCAPDLKSCNNSF